MKILHAADLHIDSPLRGLAAYEGAPVTEIRGATRRAVENLVATAMARAVDLVVVAGDVFDGEWKDFNTGLFWGAQLARLHEAGIPVVLIAGNHDAVSEVGRHLRLPPSVTMLGTARPETARLDHLDLAVVGQSYATRAVSVDMAAAYPLADPALFTVGLLHTSLDGRPGHAAYAPTTLDVLRSRGYQYWGLGHIHQREVVCADPWIVFSGNTQGRHARELGPRGATLVTVEGREVRAVEAIPLDVVRWTECQVDLTGLTRLDDVWDAARTALEVAVADAATGLVAARVRLHGRSALHAALWRDPERVAAEIRVLATGRGDLWVEKVRLDTRREAALDGDLLAPLVERAHAAMADPGRLASYVALFADLRAKLPHELRVSADAVGDGAPPVGGDAHVLASLDGSLELIRSLLDEEPA